jgi:hypothetical protein
MNTNESAAASALVANGIWGRRWVISQCIAPEVLAAAAVGTNPGHTALAVMASGGSRRWSSQVNKEPLAWSSAGAVGVVSMLELGIAEVEADGPAVRTGPAGGLLHHRGHGDLSGPAFC